MQTRYTDIACAALQLYLFVIAHPVSLFSLLLGLLNSMDIDDIALKPIPVAEPSIWDRAPTHGRGERFLRGPIPWWWLSAAAIASGRGSGFKVAVAIWHLSGLNGQRKTVRLSGRALRDLGVSRYSAYRGLTGLEQAGLLKAHRHVGRCPIVTLLDREQL